MEHRQTASAANGSTSAQRRRDRSSDRTAIYVIDTSSRCDTRIASSGALAPLAITNTLERQCMRRARAARGRPVPNRSMTRARNVRARFSRASKHSNPEAAGAMTPRSKPPSQAVPKQTRGYEPQATRRRHAAGTPDSVGVFMTELLACVYSCFCHSEHYGQKNASLRILRRFRHETRDLRAELHQRQHGRLRQRQHLVEPRRDVREEAEHVLDASLGFLRRVAILLELLHALAQEPGASARSRAACAAP